MSTWRDIVAWLSGRRPATGRLGQSADSSPSRSDECDSNGRAINERSQTDPSERERAGVSGSASLGGEEAERRRTVSGKTGSSKVASKSAVNKPASGKVASKSAATPAKPAECARCTAAAKSAGSRSVRGAGVRDESATQFPGRQSDTVDLVIGLDFGTSSTKVVVRSPFVRSRAVAVSWPIGNGDRGYLLPTLLYQARQGQFSLDASERGKGQGDLKVNLMDHPRDVTARAQAAAYLGLTLRTARRRFLATQRKYYGSFRIRWALNLGIPSAGYDDEECRGAFRAVAQTAWALSLRPDLPMEGGAVAALGAAGRDSAVQIDVVPEIAAEVVGYARSRHRREGLHVMVDVGASTVDICGFVLHARDGDDRYELLTALVERLGVRELHLRRMGAIKAAGVRLRPSVPVSLDSFAAIPDSASGYMDREDSCGPLRDELNRVDGDYVQNCANALN